MPMRLRELCSYLRAVPDVEVLEPNKGSHWKVRAPGYGTYPIPAHNGLRTEIPDHYLKGVARHLGLPDDYFLKMGKN